MSDPERETFEQGHRPTQMQIFRGRSQARLQLPD